MQKPGIVLNSRRSVVMVSFRPSSRIPKSCFAKAILTFCNIAESLGSETIILLSPLFWHIASNEKNTKVRQQTIFNTMNNYFLKLRYHKIARDMNISINPQLKLSTCSTLFFSTNNVCVGNANSIPSSSKRSNICKHISWLVSINTLKSADNTK